MKLTVIKLTVISLVSFLLFGSTSVLSQPSIGAYRYKTVAPGVDKKIFGVMQNYFDAIAEGDVAGHVGVSKFGHGDDSDSGEEVWDGANNATGPGPGPYTFLNDDVFATMYISSDDAADLSISYNVQGIDSNYNHASRTCTTDASSGFNFVACDSGSADNTDIAGDDTNMWWRIYRVKCIKAQTNTKGACAAGNIMISSSNVDTAGGANGIPDTASTIKAIVEPEHNQTEMAIWTVPSGKTFYLTSFYVGAIDNTDVVFGIYVREFNSSQQNKKVAVVNANTSPIPWVVPIAVPEKSDIYIRVLTATNAETVAGFDGWYE